jgi:hypothetical protein
MARGDNGKRAEGAERRIPLFWRRKALKGESQERSGVKKTREDGETETAERVETLRAESVG